MGRSRRAKIMQAQTALTSALVSEASVGAALMSSFSDNEPTRNRKEISFKMWDFIKYRFPTKAMHEAGNDKPVFSFALDRFQNFFGPEPTLDPLGTGGTNNRIKSVTLWCMSPFEPIAYNVSSTPPAPYTYRPKITVLPLVLAGVPVERTDDDEGSALIGQSSTAVHVDQRQAWVKVGHWNWMSLFDNTQFEPKFASDTPQTKVELFRFCVLDAATGDPISNVENTELDAGLTFRVSVELVAPITLVPDPVRLEIYTDKFTGSSIPSGSWQATESPVQYELLRLSDVI